MNTPHVLEHLPLWCEGDLGPSEQAAIEGHLARCNTCREASEAMKASQACLREAMASPFDASDRERLRRRVMDQIRAEPAARSLRRLVVRPALLAACAASLLVAALISRFEHHSIEPSGPSAPPTRLAAHLAPAIPLDTLYHAAVAARPPRIKPAPRPDTPPPGSSPPGAPARIEFQTADPSIRIIWLAQATPLSDANPSLQEAP